MGCWGRWGQTYAGKVSRNTRHMKSTMCSWQSFSLNSFRKEASLRQISYPKGLTSTRFKIYPHAIIIAMELLIKFAIFVMKIEFTVAFWLIGFIMRFWRTMLIAVILGGIFFAAVYLYNYYTLEVPNMNIIYTLIAIWLVTVYFSYEREKNKDISSALNAFKRFHENFQQRIEKELIKDKSLFPRL